MDFTNIPVWVKSIVAAFITGAAGAALSILEASISSGVADYHTAWKAGLASGLVGVLAYLKQSPLPAGTDNTGGGAGAPKISRLDGPWNRSGYDPKDGSSGTLRTAMASLLGGVMLLSSACGNDRTLAKVGYDLNVGINQTTHTLVDLRNNGIIYKDDDEGYRKFLTHISTTQADADALNKQLDALVVLDANNKDAILAQIDKVATDLVEAKALGGHKLPPHVLAKIVAGQAVLNGARIVVASYKGTKPKPLAKVKFAPVAVQ